MSSKTRQIILLIALLGLALLSGTVSAQESQRPSLYTYGCEFQEDPGQVQIRLALANRSGLPMEPTEVRVRDVNGDANVPAESVTLQRAEPRLPVRLMIVVDTTLNYPSEAMRDALENSILGSPFLFANDEVGLVKFDVAASQLGAPMLDKGALFNAQGSKLRALREQDQGSAVLYDGIMLALDNATDPARQRLVVMVVSDSAHSTEQSGTTIDTVIARANEVKAQIYTLMFVNIAPHIPDLNAARQLASGTNGFFWVYGDQPGDDKRPDPFSERMTQYLIEADAALNTEYLLTVPAGELTPDSNQVAGVGITVVNGTEVLDLGTVNCNVLFGNHTIAFETVSDAEKLVELDETLSIGFIVDPPPFEGETLTVKLWFNDAPLLESEDVDVSSEISLESLAEADLLDDLVVGGDNTIRLELFRGEEILSEATLTGVRLQQRMALTCGTGEDATCTDVSGPMTLNATLEGGAPLPTGAVVHFQMRAGGGPFQVLNQSGSIALTTGEGAVFPVDNINSKITELFGDAPENVEAIAFVGDTLDDAIFVSDPVPVTLAEVVIATEEPATEVPVVGATPQVEVPDVPPAAVPLNPLIVPLAIAGLLILIDIILLRRIRVARVKRLIRFPDNFELPGTPMKMTIRRNGQSQMHVLSKRTMNLGRGSSNDINLADDTNVSREHGVVMWRRGQWLYTNRKPETRVSIDNKNVKGYRARPLRDGTQIQIGDYRLVCHYDMDADPDSLMETQF